MTRIDPIMRNLTVVAVLALVAAVWFGLASVRTANDPIVTRAAERDNVLAAASPAMTALNTIDYRAASKAVDRWTQVTSGELHSNLSGDRDFQVSNATSAKTVATATLRRIAISALDTGAGKATVLAVVDIRVSTHGAPPARRQSNLVADLSRSGDTWKVDSLQGAS